MWNNGNESFVHECLGCAVIDSGCTSTVSGTQWLDSYIASLHDSEKALLKTLPCKKKYRFGDGKEVQSIKKVVLPVMLRTTKVSLSVDVLPVNIPLLLSKESLKRGNANIDFKRNHLLILGEDIPLRETSSGHLLLPLCLDSLDDHTSFVDAILLSSSLDCDSTEDKKKKVLKLHRQFAHPPAHRLKKLLSDAGVDDKSVLATVDEVTSGCKTCEKSPTAPLKPAVGFPLATSFNETVAMDLKQLKHGIYILH